MGGPEPPPKLEKVTPKKVREFYNKLRAYQIANHIKEIKFDADKNEVKRTPDGIIIMIEG